MLGEWALSGLPGGSDGSDGKLTSARGHVFFAVSLSTTSIIRPSLGPSNLLSTRNTSLKPLVSRGRWDNSNESPSSPDSTRTKAPGSSPRRCRPTKISKGSSGTCCPYFRRVLWRRSLRFILTRHRMRLVRSRPILAWELSGIGRRRRMGITLTSRQSGGTRWGLLGRWMGRRRFGSIISIGLFLVSLESDVAAV